MNMAALLKRSYGIIGLYVLSAALILYIAFSILAKV